MSSVDIQYPDILTGKITVSSIFGNYTKNGNLSSYGVDLNFDEMRQFKKLKSSDLHTLTCKIENTLTSWAKAYERHLDTVKKEKKQSSVEQMNQEAADHLAALEGILMHTLDADDTVDWSAIKRKEPFRINPKDIIVGYTKAPEHINFASNGRPMDFEKATPPKKPTIEQVMANYGLLSRMFRKAAIKEDFDNKLQKWQKTKDDTDAENERRKTLLENLSKAFNTKEARFEKEKAEDNAAFEDIRMRYRTHDPKAIEEYCDIVLTTSEYPDGIPRNWEIEYRPEPKMILVQMDLPSPDDMPEVESFKYVKTRDAVEGKKLSDAVRKKLYDSVVYQICLRTLHELFEADAAKAVESVVFNGVVTSRNPATGIMETKVIVSVSADKQSFMLIDLANVDPKATFKHLKGVSAAALHGLTPIPPIIQLDKTDRRVIEGKSVDIDASTNLAAMHWEDFEHLVRNLFEREFTVSGGEVKVTQASSDGGVDAIAFDPDPIRGGKIVIQAKRYTNIVGVAAVRDLYGTVMNEGATKGILVTTSEYGKDSYEFAKGKPLTLLNGSNLLAMLEKHGHKAHIDTVAAKKILGLGG